HHRLPRRRARRDVATHPHAHAPHRPGLTRAARPRRRTPAHPRTRPPAHPRTRAATLPTTLPPTRGKRAAALGRYTRNPLVGGWGQAVRGSGARVRRVGQAAWVRRR